MASSIVGTTAFSALIAPDIFRVYEGWGKERPTEWDKVFNEIEMPYQGIKMQQVAAIGTVPAKPEGTGFVLDAPVIENNITLNAVAYGLAVEFTYEAWVDEQYGVFKDVAALMAKSARYREEVQAWSVLNNATSSSFTGFDTLSLLNTAHLAAAPGQATQANRPSPDVGFSQTGLQASVLRYHSMLDDRGLQQIMFPKIVLVTPTNLFAAREVLGSTNKPYTANNEINALVPEDFRVMVCHYITTATNWFLIADKGEHDMNFGYRDHIQLDSFDDPWTKNAVFTIYLRVIGWFGEWRGVDGSTG